MVVYLQKRLKHPDSRLVVLMMHDAGIEYVALHTSGISWSD